jgi:hypothetical protein
VQAVRDTLATLLPTGDNKTDKALQKAIAKLNQGLAVAFWQLPDGNHLTNRGESAFHRLRDAVKELVKIKNPSATIINAINTLVTVSFRLAEIAIDEATAASGDAGKLAKAAQEMTKAQQDLGKGKFANAISHYEEAWEYAQKSVGNILVAATEAEAPEDEDHTHEEDADEAAQTDQVFLPLIVSDAP